MQDYNKKNLIFLSIIFAAALVVFFTVVMLTYVGRSGIWSAVIPVAAIAYGVYSFIKKYLPLTK